jgi:hypothetical protein
MNTVLHHLETTVLKQPEAEGYPPAFEGYPPAFEL